jgi:CRISPR-associated protein Cas2
MRNVFLVCYDVCDNKRLRKVYKLMRGYGDHLQLSVFRCELSGRERAQLIADLTPVINHDEDQVLVVDIGPAEGRGSMVFESIGRAYTAPERLALVV